MEFRARRANPLSQRSLDVHVDVSKPGLELEFTRLDVREDFHETGFYLEKFFGSKRAYLQPGAGVGNSTNSKSFSDFVTFHVLRG